MLRKIFRGRKILADFLGDAELRSVMSDGYNAYVFIGNELGSARFKDMVYQVCLFHLRNKFAKAENQGYEAETESEDIKELFEKERGYTEARLTPGERLCERQGLATKMIVIRICSRLGRELPKALEFRSQYYSEALNYLRKFWRALFAYLDDGELPLDYNLPNGPSVS